jgi:hypothetical protein
MRYMLLIAATALAASTSASFARTGHPVRHYAPGYGATQSDRVPAPRSWLELEHELDPCHCDGGAP